MRRVRWLVFRVCVLLPSLGFGGVGAGPVRDFFVALEKHDFGRALAYTEGSASTTIRRVLDAIDREAALKHAQVELRVESLRVAARPPDAAGRTSVQVTYDIQIFGKKWWLRWPARRLAGSAEFYTNGPRIVAIVGQLDP